MDKLQFANSKEGIDYVQELADSRDDFETLLIESLNAADDSCKDGQLYEPLYEALDWPLDLNGYIKYLSDFACWVPQQSDLPAWNVEGVGSQEVYDRLCHFYYLIDQPVGPDSKTMVQSIEGFDQWLVAYANIWGDFLDTTDSFSDEILETFIKYSPEFRVQDSMIGDPPRPNNPSGWLTFNQFFARELNPGLRPIASPCDNSVVTMPADCTYRKIYPIDAESRIEEIIVKQTHKYAEIETLLDGDAALAQSYANGTFVHYFLGPYSYHRFHAPVSGKVITSKAVKGLVYLEVNLDAEKRQFDAPDNAENGYEFYQARGILTIDTRNSPHGNMGIVTVIPVGMCQVSSVNMTAVEGKDILKGEEFGYFLFGGSDIILLFQEGHVPDINLDGDTYRYYGTDISTVPDSVK